jgi:hypothetical protein
MKYVISVDPGKATGVCLVKWSGDQDETPSVMMSSEVQSDEFAKWFEIGRASCRERVYASV